MNLTEQESIFCQALAMTSLLGELSNKDFLNSDYYNENITFIGNNDIFKWTEEYPITSNFWRDF